MSDKQHQDWCEGESDHAHDCKTATALGRLRAFAESVKNETSCTEPDDECDPDDCLYHAALQALAVPGG